MVVNQFEIWWADVFQSVPGAYTFNPADFVVPNNFQSMDWPATIGELIDQLGANVAIKYYVSIYGTSGPITDCIGSPEIIASLSYRTDADVFVQTEQIAVAAPDALGIISGTGDPVTRQGDKWTQIAMGSFLPIDFGVSLRCGETTRCDCENGLPDLSMLSFSIRMTVTADLLSYCTIDAAKTQNMSDPVCYNYMSSFIADYGSTPAIDAALTGYCGAKYGESDLSIFENCNLPGDDCSVCPCHMPQSAYDQYYTDLQKQVTIKDKTIPAKCFVPACIADTKYPGSCASGNCLTGVKIQAGNLVGPGVGVSESATCQGIVAVSDGSIETGISWITIMVVILAIALVITIICLIVFRKKIFGTSEVEAYDSFPIVTDSVDWGT